MTDPTAAWWRTALARLSPPCIFAIPGVVTGLTDIRLWLTYLIQHWAFFWHPFLTSAVDELTCSLFLVGSAMVVATHCRLSFPLALSGCRAHWGWHGLHLLLNQVVCPSLWLGSLGHCQLRLMTSDFQLRVCFTWVPRKSWGVKPFIWPLHSAFFSRWGQSPQLVVSSQSPGQEAENNPSILCSPFLHKHSSIPCMHPVTVQRDGNVLPLAICLLSVSMLQQYLKHYLFISHSYKQILETSHWWWTRSQ